MKPPTIELNRQMLSKFEDAIQKEWIITNGLGGYVSSTVLGINTRKYHGLLVAAFNPPRDRRVCLSKLDEEISIGSNIYPLGANEFQNEILPKGHHYLKAFSLSPLPKYTYAVQNVEVQKTIFMPYGKNAVVTVYNVSNLNDYDVKIRVFPLINSRHFHSTTDRRRLPWDFVQEHNNREVNARFVPQSRLIMTSTQGRYFSKGGKWIEKIYFREEASRGESCLDDCYQPGYFETQVSANKSGKFAISVIAHKNHEEARGILAEMPVNMHDVEAMYEKEVERRGDLLAKFYDIHNNVLASDWLNWIVSATDMFIAEVVNAGQGSVIAGYHWFEEWGRDAFISLPGLMLVTGRFEDARSTFLKFKNHCKKGLIPNVFSDGAAKQPVYNAVDANLWYVNAVLQYLKYTNDFRFIRESLWETLKTMSENYVEGTAFGVGMDSDCLLSHGPQLTWMDTSIDGQPVTPRTGKAVEIQALWYNALKIMQLLAIKFKEKNEAEKHSRIAESAKKSFAREFWNPEENCLFDVVNRHDKDTSLRPNQIIAVALDFAMLDDSRNEKLVDAVHRELLTPYGLRTLAQKDPNYVGVYAGDRRSRDKAYHNGTVWPWLLGPFTKAFLKTKGYTEHRREYSLKSFLLPLFTEEISKAGIGTLSEIFDGQPPHTPRGCIAQAWSVAEPLRAYVEDVMYTRPRYEKEILQNSR
jgi:predicted glycogen debranching enzyme